MKEIYYLGKNEIHLKRENSIQRLYVEVTSQCNLSCKMCFMKNFVDKSVAMSQSTMDRLIHNLDLLPNLRRIIIGGIGEPFIHPQLKKLLEIIASKNIGLSLQTNGTLLDEPTIDFLLQNEIDQIILSFEESDLGHSHDTNIFTVVKRIIKKKSNRSGTLPKIAIQSVLTRDNIDELPLTAGKFIDLGVDEFILTNLLPVHTDHASQTLYFSDESQKLLEPFQHIVRHRCHTTLPNFTLKTERNCDFVDNNATVLSSTGNIVPCYRFLHDTKELINNHWQEIQAYPFGNIHQQDIASIWQSRAYMWFRYVVQNSRYPSCFDCQFREGCYYMNDSSSDCWGNSPACSHCLWSRKILICP